MNDSTKKPISDILNDCHLDDLVLLYVVGKDVKFKGKLVGYFFPAAADGSLFKDEDTDCSLLMCCGTCGPYEDFDEAEKDDKGTDFPGVSFNSETGKMGAYLVTHYEILKRAPEQEIRYVEFEVPENKEP